MIDRTPLDHSKLGVFILTHGRADNCLTHKMLRASGYTGKIYLLIDDEDDQADKYRENFGAENVVQFCKRDVARRVDTGDTRDDRKAIVFARNAAFDVAAEMGFDYHLQLDDDYSGIYRRWVDEAAQKLRAAKLLNLDAVFEATLTFLDASGASCVSYAQGGDLIGGISQGQKGNYRQGLVRKSMNTLFFRRDRRVTFRGRFNEDASAYINGAARGELFLCYTGINIVTPPTQSASGGMTDTYLGSGTYVKTMYSVVSQPAFVKVAMMGNVNRRYHHFVDWPKATPKILSAKHRVGVAP